MCMNHLWWPEYCWFEIWYAHGACFHTIKLLQSILHLMSKGINSTHSYHHSESEIACSGDFTQHSFVDIVFPAKDKEIDSVIKPALNKGLDVPIQFCMDQFLGLGNPLRIGRRRGTKGVNFLISQLYLSSTLY